MPLVSVIIPTYNRRSFVAEAVASVLSQTWEDLDLWVVDDGGTDGTPEHLAATVRDPRMRVLSQPPRGVSAARNRGVRESCGEWVAFLDSDDLWLPGKLERQLQAVGAEPGTVACYTGEVWYRNGRWANPCAHHRKPSGRIFSQCLKLCLISPSSILMRREVFDGLGGFDETLPACEDYDLWLRLAARVPVLLIPERLIVKRNGHEGQLSRAHWGLDRFRVRALWKVGLDPSLDREIRREAFATAQQKSEIVARGAAKRGALERAQTFWHAAREARKWVERLSGES